MGDYECLRKKRKAADLVVEKDIPELKTWSPEKRISSWNEIGSNKENVETGDCGEFPRNVTEEFYATSWLALAKLAVCNYELGEILPAPTLNHKEIVVTRELESCHPIDLISKEELKGRIIARDESIVDLMGIVLRLEEKQDEIRKDKEIKKILKIAIRKYYGERIEKCKTALRELDPTLIEKLRKEYEEKEKKHREEELEKVKRYIVDQRRKKEDEEKLRAEREKKIKEGALTGPVARSEEIKWAQTFHSKMEELKNVKIANPRDGNEYEICFREELDDEEIKKEFPEKVGAGEIPLNVRVRYMIGKKHLVRKREVKMIFEARVVSHWRKYGDVDYDDESGDLKDFNVVVSKSLKEADRGNYFYVLGIACPTGWSEEVRKFIYSSDFHRNYVSKYVPVCLIDIRPKEPLSSRTFIYNKNDTWIKDYLYLFHPQLQREGIEIAKRKIKERLFVDMERSVTIEEIMKETSQNFITVKEAFYQLEDEGAGKAQWEDRTFRKFHEMEKERGWSK